MSGLRKKRCREEEALLESPKRFHGGTEQQILHLLDDIESVDKIQGEEEECLCGASEEVVTGVMRSLGEEIGVTSCSASYQSSSSGLSSDTSPASEITSGYGTSEGVIDLDYLLGASDDELGIPPSPLVNIEDQAIFSLKDEGYVPCLDFAETAELKGFVDNWHFEDDLVDYNQFAVCEDTVSAALDVMNHGAFIDGDYSAPWGLETVCSMY